MMCCGKMGANASGPTGSLVAGLRGGASSNGRSGTMLYQLFGKDFSSSRNFVDSIFSPYLSVISPAELSRAPNACQRCFRNDATPWANSHAPLLAPKGADLSSQQHPEEPLAS